MMDRREGEFKGREQHKQRSRGVSSAQVWMQSMCGGTHGKHSLKGSRDPIVMAFHDTIES